MNTQELFNIADQLKERLEDNPFNYEINQYAHNIILRELAARGKKVSEMREEMKRLKELYYKNTQTDEERFKTYQEIQELARKILNVM